MNLPRRKVISPLQMKNLREGLSNQKTGAELYIKLLDIHEKFLSGIADLHEIVNKKVGPKGEKGPKGDRGIDGPPGKSVSVEEVARVVQTMIRLPKDGKDGKDGQTPMKGVHYFTPEDIDHVAKIASSLVKISSIQKEIDPLAILDAVSKLPAGKRISSKLIDGLDQTLSALKNQTKHGYLHGAGITALTAGSNIILTKDANGNYIISATGAVGAPTSPTSGSINGVNTVFTFAKKPTLIVSDDATYRENHGWTWNSLTLTATMAMPPTYDIYAL